MNKKVIKANDVFRNSPIDNASMEVTQRNNKRTVIDTSGLDLDRVQELLDMTGGDGLIRPVPYEEIRHDSPDTLNMVMKLQGLYTFPTQELVDFLHGEIDDDPNYEPHSAIEICAGKGWLGRSLGIPVTDSRLQEREEIRSAYLQQGAVPIVYPDDVECLDAVSAVKKYNPEYVIASYCTHLYGTGSLKSGNSYGVDTRWLVNNCRRFYHIGNDDIHGRDPIMKRPHKRWKFEWLVTRGDSEHARIYMWENKMF